MGVGVLGSTQGPLLSCSWGDAAWWCHELRTSVPSFTHRNVHLPSVLSPSLIPHLFHKTAVFSKLIRGSITTWGQTGSVVPLWVGATALCRDVPGQGRARRTLHVCWDVHGCYSAPPALTAALWASLHRQRDHAGGGRALGAGQPAEAGQEGAHLLHRRAAAGSGAGPGAGGARGARPHPHPSARRPPGHAGTVCSGQQPRRTNASETRRHDGAESESHSGRGSRGASAWGTGEVRAPALPWWMEKGAEGGHW